MISLILLTGFLGAGKTTLMRDILYRYRNYKIGVIVNDFGKVNIDAMIIQRDGVMMTELNNGSIFCACIKENFIQGLIEMSKMDLKFLFVEASGLADPANIGQILASIKGKTERRYKYKGSICIVDAVNYIGMAEALPSLIRQVEYSSLVIINKSDLVNKAELQDIALRISEINPHTGIMITSFCKVDIKEIIGKLVPSKKKPVESSNRIESRPKSIILKAEKEVPKAYLISLIREIADATYRIKGFANTDEGVLEINCVGEKISIVPCEKYVEATQIVIISSVGIRIISIVTDALKKHLNGILHI